jgi:CRISPR-associated protein Cas5 subtype I-B
LRIVSFDLEGDFAAFRDPSVTTNQTVTVIPSKSAIIGLIGALLGVQRSDSIFDDIYSARYLDLLKNTLIGIMVKSEPVKLAFFTNHRSLKEAKTKPFKTELLVNPCYTIFVKSTDDVNNALLERLNGNSFVFSPTLGQSYCFARIPSFTKIDDVKEVKPDDRVVSTVFLDEVVESNGGISGVKFDTNGVPTRVVVERHLHHYFKSDSLKRTVLRHFIPVPVDSVRSSVRLFHFDSRLSLAKFYAFDDSEAALCLY